MRDHARLARLTKPLAASFMARHEHLGNLGLGVWHWGLAYCEQVAGVVSYGTTCFSQQRSWLGQIAAAASTRLIQLCRGGCAPWAPRGAASFLISKANRAMAQLLGPVVIVAYATPEMGEVGTIYQACNAIYTGMTNPKSQANYLVGGKIISGWKVRKQYGTRDRAKLSLLIPDLEVIPLRPRHRYVMVAGSLTVARQIRRSLESHSLPYPKRELLGIRSMKGMRGIPAERPARWPKAAAVPVA